MKKLTVVAASILFVSASVWAAPDQNLASGLSASWQAQEQLQSEMHSGLVDGVAKQALDVLVAQGVQALRDVGETALADQYEREWQNQISLCLTRGSFGTLDLGDHDPLSPWLADFYNTLVLKTHGLIKAMQIASDINTMNYALGVVLRPNGAWRTHTSYDRIEYRKHFIPFADITTYWVSLEACKYYAAAYSDVCSYGAQMLEHYMGRYAAPVLSDQVYHLTTGEPIPPLPVPPHPPHHGVLTQQSFQASVMQTLQ